VLHARWPPGTAVRVVTSPVGIGPAVSSFASLREARASARQGRQEIAQTHARVAADLRDAGLTVKTSTVSGNPERAVVADAERFGADLVVVGARRQGSIAATLLGSVSRAVVEGASCSVLVARSVATRRLLLATDGSRQSQHATAMVATWPIFEDASVMLIGVGEAPSRYPNTVLSDEERREAYRGTIADSTSDANSVVQEAADTLQATGRQVKSEVRLGEVAAEVIAAAREWPADMVVVGCNSEPLLRRLVLGSVARKVVDGVAASVLIARSGVISVFPPAGDSPPA
jgi:nucleotide-binding universal stress UspA family protein